MNPNSLSHVMLIDDVEKTCGSVSLGMHSILFNIDKISEAEARRIVDTGDYSPYVLCIPKEQFYGLFKNQEVSK